MKLDNFTEEEIQALIISIELFDPITTPNNTHYSFFPKTVKEAKHYFYGYALDKTFDISQHPGLFNYYDAAGLLTKKGKETAGVLRSLRPPIYYWYRKYYSAIEKSAAFSKYCTEIFSSDIDQFGFSSMNQIDKISELLSVDAHSISLDIGCGNGKIAQYLSRITKSSFVGIDYIPEAIRSAERRVDNKKLKFEIRHIDDLQVEEKFFDAVLAIDSIFYGSSYSRIFSDIKRVLKDDGVLVFTAPEDLVMETELRNYFSFEKFDYTEDGFTFMKRKNSIMKKYEKEFEKESNSFIWNQYMMESFNESIREIPDNFSRFIYRAVRA